MPRCHMRDELGLQVYVSVSGVALGIPAISGSARHGNHDGWVLDNARSDPYLASQGCSALHAVRLVLR